jgi:hypothetical protein
MEFTRLGGCGAEVSRLAIGTMTFGTQMNEESAHRLLEQLQPFFAQFRDAARPGHHVAARCRAADARRALEYVRMKR